MPRIKCYLLTPYRKKEPSHILIFKNEKCVEVYLDILNPTVYNMDYKNIFDISDNKWYKHEEVDEKWLKLHHSKIILDIYSKL